MPRETTADSGRAAPAGRESESRRQPAGMEQYAQLGLQLLVVFFVFRIMQGFNDPKTIIASQSDLQGAPAATGAPAAGVGSGTTGTSASAGEFAQPTKLRGAVSNSWPRDLQYSLKMFLSEAPPQSFSPESASSVRIWDQDKLMYNEKDDNKRSFETNVSLPKSFVQNNSSMYLYVLLTPDGDTSMKRPVTSHYQLVEWRYKNPNSEGRSLLGANADDEVPDKSSSDVVHESDGQGEYMRYWNPYVYVQLLTDWKKLGTNQIPPQIEHFFVVDEQTKTYQPVIYFNEFFSLKEKYLDANESTYELPLKIDFAPTQWWKFALLSQMEQNWKGNMMGNIQEKEVDELKRMFMETNPYLLGLTAVVTVAHTVLEMLAFKSDISHWRSVKSMEGVSIRSMFWKIGMEFVIFLYLLDSETSWTVLLGAGASVVIEIWKLGKAVDYRSFGKVKLFGVIPWVEYEEKESYSKSKTKEYDEQAMKYLGYVLYPCVVLYAIYSLLYDKHKSWYSWILSSLVGAVYAFGFIMMFPQIFINYKLKSVAHLPMRAFLFKALNTFIDDLFSFIIKMPTMHRLACFRDDIVFAIFLYQKWIYPVDKTRVNEFGQVFDEPKVTKKKKTKSTKKSVKSGAVGEASSSTESSLAAVEKDKEEKKND